MKPVITWEKNTLIHKICKIIGINILITLPSLKCLPYLSMKNISFSRNVSRQLHKWKNKMQFNKSRSWCQSLIFEDWATVIITLLYAFIGLPLKSYIVYPIVQLISYFLVTLVCVYWNKLCNFVFALHRPGRRGENNQIFL